jgi:uncharacterized protein
MPPVFVDTGGWLALLRRDDRMHERARRFYGRLVADRARLLTTNYVVDETATRLRYDAGLGAALAFRAALDRSTAGGGLRIAWIDPKLEREGWDVFGQHADVALSLTDAVSAVVARRAKVRQVFGFDADFRALGFDVQPST